MSLVFDVLGDDFTLSAYFSGEDIIELYKWLWMGGLSVVVVFWWSLLKLTLAFLICYFGMFIISICFYIGENNLCLLIGLLILYSFSIIMWLKFCSFNDSFIWVGGSIGICWRGFRLIKLRQLWSAEIMSWDWASSCSSTGSS